MKTAGIIAEYNPFHNGHARHVAKTREAGFTHVVAVMSGCFVQRGEPALLSKAARAEMALRNGVDLVVELPSVYSMASAGYFAQAAVGLLDRMGVVDALSFGSECGDLELLKTASLAVDSPEIKPVLRTFLDRGVSFATARQAAVKAVFGEETAAVLVSPNNLLAAEYLSVVRAVSSKMAAFTVKREGSLHDGTNPKHQLCASQIREFVRTGQLNRETLALSMPESSLAILERETGRGALVNTEKFETAALSRLRAMECSAFELPPDVSEGLHTRIYEASRYALTLDELYAAAKTKRYAHSRIRRAIMAAVINLPGEIPAEVPYARVLGMGEKGRELLRVMKDKSRIPIAMRGSRITGLGDGAQKVFALECAAADLIALTLEQPASCGGEYRFQVILT